MVSDAQVFTIIPTWNYLKLSEGVQTIQSAFVLLLVIHTGSEDQSKSRINQLRHVNIF